MSSVDTFEYKPELEKRNGKPGPGGGTITASRFKFKQYGESGAHFSELLPNIATHADDLCFLRGLYTDNRFFSSSTRISGTPIFFPSP
jgi:hypothetical protein